jgi:hypothetical protein
MTATFYRYSYLDHKGKLQISSALPKLIRRILISANMFIVSMRSLVGLALAMAVAYIGHPFL